METSCRKVYVKVDAEFTEDGRLRPKSLEWEDGTTFSIDRILDQRSFDYQINNKTGKPAGNDIQEHKMTLPLIHLLKIVDKSERRNIIRKIKYHSDEVEARMDIINKVHQNNCLDYAKEKMNDFVRDALLQLDEIKDDAALTSLKNLVEFCIEREK